MPSRNLSLRILLVLCTTAPLLAADPRGHPPNFDAAHHPTRVLVRFKPGTTEGTRQGAHATALTQNVLQEYSVVPGLQLVEVPNGQVPAAVNAYRNNPNVLYAEPDYVIHLAAVPNDAYFSNLWGLHNTGQTVNGDTSTHPGADIKAPEAWDKWTGDPNFRIAVLDTGVNYFHQDLQANIWTNEQELNGQSGYDDDLNGYIDDIHGYNFASGYANPSDPLDDHVDGHGTLVAGIIGAVGNNAVPGGFNGGVVGVNWRCKIVALKVLDSNGDGYVSALVNAMRYVIKNNIRLSNASVGFCEVGVDSEALYELIQASQTEVIGGHLLVAAAGNVPSPNNCPSVRDNDLSPHYPASYDLQNVISVAATNNDDELASFSHYGLTTVDLGAPGVNIYSTLYPGINTYAFKSGTSFAAPHVTGVVALVMSRYPNLTWAQVRNRVLWTVRPLDSLRNLTATGGMVNALAAVWDCNGNGIDDACDVSCSAEHVP